MDKPEDHPIDGEPEYHPTDGEPKDPPVNEKPDHPTDKEPKDSPANNPLSWLWGLRVPHLGLRVPDWLSFHSFFGLGGVLQCSQRGSPSVLSQDQDGRRLVVPSRHFLKLPDK